MKARIGHIQFLNSLPLYHMLVKEEIVLEIDLFEDNPRQLCRKLLDRRLDISPVPAIEYARHANELLRKLVLSYQLHNFGRLNEKL